MTMDPRFSPVVAIDVDGVLKVGGPDPGTRPAEGVFKRRVTIYEDGYPSYMHRQPLWDDGAWRATHWFSGIGAEWVRELLSSGIDVALATTWRDAANRYFARPLRLPQLPVATMTPGAPWWSSSYWKAVELGPAFHGRPLMWVDDQKSADALQKLHQLRRPRDRALTHFQWVTEWTSGITREDVAAMNEWLELAGTPEGHDELRRRRQLEQARLRYRIHKHHHGTYANYKRWRAIHARLLHAFGDQTVFVAMIADLASKSPSSVDRATIAGILTDWGGPDAPEPDTIIRALGDAYGDSGIPRERMPN